MADERQTILAVIFNRERTHVMMRWFDKYRCYNFINGKSMQGEQYGDSTYVELNQQLKLTPDDIELKYVRLEMVLSGVPGCKESETTYVMTGILNRDFEFTDKHNDLAWIPVEEHEIFQYDTFGNGKGWMLLNEAAAVLGISIKK